MLPAMADLIATRRNDVQGALLLDGYKTTASATNSSANFATPRPAPPRVMKAASCRMESTAFATDRAFTAFEKRVVVLGIAHTHDFMEE